MTRDPGGNGTPASNAGVLHALDLTTGADRCTFDGGGPSSGADFWPYTFIGNLLLPARVASTVYEVSTSDAVSPLRVVGARRSVCS